MSVKRLAVVCAGLLAAGTLYNLPGIHAAAGDGTLYSAAQSERGKSLYEKQCAACHRADLSGLGQSPPLTGDEFLAKYDDEPILFLFTKIRTTMPAIAPGSLSGTDTAAILAYMLSLNNFPAGAADLPGDDESLGKIQLVKPVKK